MEVKGRERREKFRFGGGGGGRGQRRGKNERSLRNIHPWSRGLLASSNKTELYLYTKY